MQSLKQIEEQQKELQAAIQNAKADRERMLKKDRDFYNPAAKELPAPRMEVCVLAAAAQCEERAACAQWAVQDGILSESLAYRS